MPPYATAQTLRRAIAFHRQGALAQAEQLYASILNAHPANFDALNLLGMLRLQQGQPAAAVPLIEAALKQRPNAAELIPNLAAALVSLGRGRDAVPWIDKLIALRPDDADAHFNRGVAMMALGDTEQALASFRKALAIKPGHIEALFNIANVLAHTAHHDDALSYYDKLIAAAPDHLDGINNRGNVLSKLKRYQDAINDYDRVLARRPDDARTLNNRGNALKNFGRFDQALTDYDRVLARHPRDADALYNRGNALLDLQRAAEAEGEFRRAIEIRPDNPDFHISLGVALMDLRRPKESADSYRHALALRPDDPKFHSDLIFSLNFDPDIDTAGQQAERTRWYERHGRSLAASNTPHTNGRDPDRPLRIGYVSSHFRRQAATYVFGGVLEHHDRNLFEIVCYSDTRKADDITTRLRAYATKWHDTADLSDEQLAELIRSDSIDILVDLVGHMAGQRLLLFARKPAPIQVTAWGEPTGTGVTTIDYLFADPVLVPQPERPQFAERIFDLPCGLAYWTPDPMPDINPLPALSRGGVTFGSFNRLHKLTPEVLRAWAAILRAVPQSRLVLKDRQLARPDQHAPLVATFAEAGVGCERIVFLDQTDRWQHFESYGQIDIALDPFPHGGGMTTLDALWMGVPVVTFPGRTVSSRIGTACAAAVGLTDFIASDLQHYLKIAVAKATDLDALAVLRAGLRARVAATPVGDPERYARAVEAAYREMWRRWCRVNA